MALRTVYTLSLQQQWVLLVLCISSSVCLGLQQVCHIVMDWDLNITKLAL